MERIKDIQELKRVLLACELGVSREEIEASEYNDSIFKYGRQEWLVVDESDAYSTAVDTALDVIIDDIEGSDLPRYLKDAIDAAEVARQIVDCDGAGVWLNADDELNLTSLKYGLEFTAYRR